MSSGQHISLRYRGPGHVRFQVPASLCAPVARRHIDTGLREIEGVYRVDCYPGQQKFSIRFIESVCSLENLSVSLYRLADEANTAVPVASCCAAVDQAVTASPSTQRGAGLAPAHWIRDKLSGVGGAGSALPWLKESTVVEFLNDALVLFLIKLHWHMITQHWLRQPWLYRYEWMASFYLIFLLVRSRRPKKS